MPGSWRRSPRRCNFIPTSPGRSCCRCRAALFGAAEHAQALALLSGKGVRFAGEGWDEAAGGGTPIGVEGLDFLKIPANRLLDRDRQRRKLVPAMAIIESAMANDLDDHRRQRGQ